MTSFDLHYLLKALSPNTVTLAVRLQHWNLGEDANIQSLEECMRFRSSVGI